MPRGLLDVSNERPDEMDYRLDRNKRLSILFTNKARFLYKNVIFTLFLLKEAKEKKSPNEFNIDEKYALSVEEAGISMGTFPQYRRRYCEWLDKILDPPYAVAIDSSWRCPRELLLYFLDQGIRQMN
ncbi:hypothetical protein TNIN_481151 [Trichonephila inaurata madagascariensis]|uniref:Uncharacterized protein n=1 Tax=Trichonephila inaurata madagascariensis TaxID=2747483 RepID=A0A8X7C8W5_9ARAC|nr:hypothetical protein TNIN_481151 [Trichonephila inaurata madagascariensis]